MTRTLPLVAQNSEIQSPPARTRSIKGWVWSLAAEKLTLEEITSPASSGWAELGRTAAHIDDHCDCCVAMNESENSPPKSLEVQMSRIVTLMIVTLLLMATTPVVFASGGDIAYTFNAADQLVEVSSGGSPVAAFTYDGDNLRTKKITTSTEIIYVRGAAGEVLAEFSKGGDLLAEYIYLDGKRLCKINTDEKGTEHRVYYHGDLVGTPLALTNGSGFVVARGENFPFGEDATANAIPGPHKFTGKELDEEIGLYYFNARYYDAKLGRFISVDPVGGGIANPQSWNRYAYVENNPLTRIDPTGETFWDVLDVGFFAASIGNLWKKALTGMPITAGDNLQVAGDAVGMLPIVPAIGTYGKGVVKVADKTGDAMRSADNASDAGTEVVQRWMSNAELEATQATGLMRGGREGTHYATDAANTSAKRARQRLSLSNTPDVRVTMEVPSGAFSSPSRVEPNFGMPGGGMERTATGNIPVEIVKVDGRP